MKTDWILLADYVETLNNKLYLMGGGWDSLTVNALPAQHTLAIAVAFSVPWNETNQKHDIQIELADQDGKVLATIDGQVEVGRPPGMPLGASQRVQMGVNASLLFERLGTYVITTRIEGQESERVTFNVVQGHLFAPQPQPQ
jgi:hypothetical protein